MLFRAKKMIKFGGPLMVTAAGWGRERETVPRAVVISNFTTTFYQRLYNDF
jgi:hypothetical protein